MSFVDDLNKQTSKEEQLKKEDTYIKLYVKNIITAIKNACLHNRDKHIASGYFGIIPYSDVYTLVDNQDNAFRIRGAVEIGLHRIEIDWNKFRKHLNKEIENLGFVNYTVEIKTYNEKIKKSFFGLKYYEEKATTDSIILISLKW